MRPPAVDAVRREQRQALRRLLDVAVIRSQQPHGLGELGHVAVLVERVTGMGRQGPEQVRAQHRRDHGAEPTARLATDGTVRRARHGAVVAVDEGHDLVTEVGVVVPGSRRVDELAAAVGRPGIDVHHDRRRRLPRGEHSVSGLDERLSERGAVAPHAQLPGVALDDVDRRVTAVRLVVVSRRHIDPQRALMGVPERVAPQSGAVEDMLVNATNGVC